MGRRGSAGGVKVPTNIVRERVDSTGTHEYCVAWASDSGVRAGFTWHTSQFLLDSGHEKLVHRFEDTAQLRSSRLKSAISPTPNASALAALEASARRLERESLLLDTPSKVPSPKLLAPLASAPPSPVLQPGPGKRRRKTTSPKNGHSSGELSCRAGNSMGHMADLTAAASHSRSLFEEFPPFDPNGSVPPKLGNEGYSPIREKLAFREAKKVAAVCWTSQDEMRRGMLRAQVSQFLVRKTSFDTGRMSHLCLNAKEKGELPGSYDRLQYVRKLAAVRIQTRVRAFHALRIFRTKVRAARLLQRRWRGWLGQQLWDAELLRQRRLRWRFRKLASLRLGVELAHLVGAGRRHKASANIQRVWRGKQGRESYDTELARQVVLHWRWRKFAALILWSRMAAFRGRLGRLTRRALGSREYGLREVGVDAFAENRERVQREREEAAEAARREAEAIAQAKARIHHARNVAASAYFAIELEYRTLLSVCSSPGLNENKPHMPIAAMAAVREAEQKQQLLGREIAALRETMAATIEVMGGNAAVAAAASGAQTTAASLGLEGTVTEDKAAAKLQAMQRGKQGREKVAAIKSAKEQKRELQRAKKKFAQMDADGNGTIEGVELDLLAKWVFESFHPNGEPVPSEVVAKEAAKLKRRLDKDNNGVLDFEEFAGWFTRTCEGIARFRKNLAQKQRQKQLDELRSQQMMAMADALGLDAAMGELREFGWLAELALTTALPPGWQLRLEPVTPAPALNGVTEQQPPLLPSQQQKQKIVFWDADAAEKDGGGGGGKGGSHPRLQELQGHVQELRKHKALTVAAVAATTPGTGGSAERNLHRRAGLEYLSAAQRVLTCIYALRDPKQVLLVADVLTEWRGDDDHQVSPPTTLEPELEPETTVAPETAVAPEPQPELEPEPEQQQPQDNEPAATAAAPAVLSSASPTVAAVFTSRLVAAAVEKAAKAAAVDEEKRRAAAKLLLKEAAKADAAASRQFQAQAKAAAKAKTTPAEATKLVEG